VEVAGKLEQRDQSTPEDNDMRTLLIAMVGVARAVDIDWVTAGDSDNQRALRS